MQLKMELVELPGGDPFTDYPVQVHADAVMGRVFNYPHPTDGHPRLFVAYYRDPAKTLTVTMTFRVSIGSAALPGDDGPHYLGSQLIGVNVYHVWIVPRMA